jgi:uncharacterized phiE125 gp8 family phage protein
MNWKPQTGYRLITAPTREVLDLEMVKKAINVDIFEDDPLIRIYMAAAVEYIESRNHILRPQTWEMTLNSFQDPIRIWKQPVISVDYIQYISDSDGTTQTWGVDQYQAILTADPPQVRLAYNASWPSARYQDEAVTVRFTAGYNNSPFSIPAQLTVAMYLFVGHLYANREAVSDGRQVELPLGLEALIENAIGQARAY